MKLYELTEQMEVVAGWIDEHADEIAAAGGELPDELAELLDGIEGEFDEKVERVALTIRQMEADARVAAYEAERLNALANSRSNAAKSLKSYLLRQMERSGRNRVEAPLATVWIQANGRPSICPVDPANPPFRFSRVRVSAVYTPEQWQSIEAACRDAGTEPPTHAVEFDGQAAYEWVKEVGMVPNGGGRIEDEVAGLVVERGVHVRTR